MNSPTAEQTRQWWQSWSDALDALEADVVAAEELLRTGRPTSAAVWRPPQGLGPLPRDLVDRADAILARQFAVTQATALAIASNRKQAAALLRVEVGSRGRPRPSYVDQRV